MDTLPKKPSREPMTPRARAQLLAFALGLGVWAAVSWLAGWQAGVMALGGIAAVLTAAARIDSDRRGE